MSQENWTFFSNHSHVLVCIAREPDMRVRDMATRIGITERAVLRIIAELTDAGVIEHTKVGRRNHYSIHLDTKLRHELEAGVSIRAILEPLVGKAALRNAGHESSKKKGRAS